MNEETIKLSIFQNLLAYNPDVPQAIEDTEKVFDRLFAKQDIGG